VFCARHSEAVTVNDASWLCWQDPVLSQANPIQCFISLTPILILSYSLVYIIWRAAMTLPLYSTASSTCPFFIRRSNQALVSPIVVQSRGCALLCYMPNGPIFRHAHLRPLREISVSVIESFYLASTCTSQWTRQSPKLYLTHEKPGLTSLVTMTTRVWISHAISHSVTPRVLNKMDPQRCFPSGFFPWGFLTEILYVLLISPMRDTCSISIIPDLITLTKVFYTIPTKYCALSETAHSPSKHKDKHGFIISQCKHTEL